MLTYYGMPLHIVRELYNTFASFQKRISDFVRYRCAPPRGGGAAPRCGAVRARRTAACFIFFPVMCHAA